jgi:glucose-1-phosphate thymidylyltransferase
MAIVIPVAVEGLRIASRVGQVGLRKSVATRVAERVLNETSITGQLQGNARRGVVQEGVDQYQWSIQSAPWTEGSMRLVTGIAAGLRPSARGELEITDLNMAYLRRGQLRVEVLGRGIAWLDTGSHDTLLQASTFIQAIEERQGLMVACIEEIAYRMNYIGAGDLLRLAEAMSSSGYGQYLRRIVEQDY